MRIAALCSVCLGLLGGSSTSASEKIGTRANDGERSLTEMNSMDGDGDDGRPADANDVTSDAEIIARVVDGSRAQPGEFPFYTAIMDEQFGIINSLVCGGTLIAERVVLSAAHCTDTGAIDKVKVG